MLNKATVTPTLPAVDIKRARKFYEEKLGLKAVREDPGPGLLMEAGKGTKIYLYQRGPTKADHTVADFTVADVEAEVKALKAKGVNFEEYDMPEMGLKTVNGIAAMDGFKSAWFKDTEGNIIGISNM
ncbi:MAG TPA: VOC family protein [Dehalococcoidales bacterium]|nr:VOC family protein [Dehalococcoidales bacterium]